MRKVAIIIIIPIPQVEKLRSQEYVFMVTESCIPELVLNMQACRTLLWHEHSVAQPLRTMGLPSLKRTHTWSGNDEATSALRSAGKRKHE